MGHQRRIVGVSLVFLFACLFAFGGEKERVVIFQEDHSDGAFKTWEEVLVPFEAELSHFKHKIDSLKKQMKNSITRRPALTNVTVSFLNGSSTRYRIDSSSKVFSDSSFQILASAPELKGLLGVQLSFRRQLKEGTQLRFHTDQPMKVLVGFFNPQRTAFSRDSVFLKAPELETNAAASDHGQADIKIANAIVISGMPPVNIHTYTFPAGNKILSLAKGVCLVLGFVKGDETIVPYDAGLTESGTEKQIDWLFE